MFQYPSQRELPASQTLQFSVPQPKAQELEFAQVPSDPQVIRVSPSHQD
jgi:hypothetical protein